ncbi:MAG: cation:proton antiporter [Chloroflexota bacterium]|nr:MAG: cation:proton antiporter [Chloroflexota bacterium]
MTPFLQLALALAVIIAAAKAGGYLSFRLGQPSVLGELLVGILLGPSVINLLELPYFTDTHLTEAVHQLAELGVLLLMFLAGLDLHLEDLFHAKKVAALAGVLGVVFPLLLGLGTGLLFSIDPGPAIFIGLVLSATSVSISAQTLMELGVLRSRVGVSLLGAAVFDDILVILGLSIFTALSSPDSGSGIWHIIRITGSMILYLTWASAVGYWLLPRLSRRVGRLPVSQGLVAFTFVIILIYGWTAETFGHMAAITGAFLAGLWLGRTPVKDRIHSGISALAYGVFVPIFFINIGLSANARQLSGQSLLLMLALILVAILGKVLGSGLGAWWGGLKRQEALQLGVGMMSRGEVGLIVAAVGITEGLIDQNIFAAIVGVVIVTTLLTPPLLRILHSKEIEKTEPEPERKEGEAV